MNVLAIDTATNVMGIALTREGKLVGELVTNLEKNHSVRLMPGIEYLMKEVSMGPEDLDKIIVSKGPGSYTGVRIGLSTAKSMAWALNIPVVGVSTLEQMAYQGRNSKALIAPFIDARRGAVFTGLYRFEDGKLLSVIEDQHIKLDEWLHILSDKEEDVLFISPDLQVHREEIKSILTKSAHFPPAIYQIGKPSDLIYAGMDKESSDVHQLTPMYLRLTEAEANWIKKNKERSKDD